MTNETTAPAPAPPVADSVLDEVIGLLCDHVHRSEVAMLCREALDIPAEAVEAVIDAATAKLARAAAIHHDEAFGVSITRLNDLYTKSALKPALYPVALRTQQELNRLLNLYPDPYAVAAADGEGGDDTEDPDARKKFENQALADLVGAIEAHIEPLELSDDTNDHYHDVIRKAGEAIVELRRRVKRPAKKAAKKKAKKKKAKKKAADLRPRASGPAKKTTARKRKKRAPTSGPEA